MRQQLAARLLAAAVSIAALSISYAQQQTPFAATRTDSNRGATPEHQPPLRNYEIYEPPHVPHEPEAKLCEVTLIQHDFSGWYRPAIVDYRVPEGCGEPEDWAAIVLNVTVTSRGRQFDRLGSLSLSHVEIWRTSTAEPTASGIIWTSLRDVTAYRPLFAREGQLMFYEDNTVDETYTGVFHTTVSATFYAATASFPRRQTADLILPLSTLSKKGDQMMRFPGPCTVSHELPPNMASAFVEIFASGNADEEFWYGNAPDQVSRRDLRAKGSFREVQLEIDGLLAGIMAPFPVLYTGGANPLLWRPLASIGAFNAKSGLVDITPFLGVLSNGHSHNFTLSVLGQGKDGGRSVLDNWYLTGNVHVVLDSSSEQRTTGEITLHDAPQRPSISTHVDEQTSDDDKGDGGGDWSIQTEVKAWHALRIAATLQTGSGSKNVSVEQYLGFENEQVWSGRGRKEEVTQLVHGSTHSTHNDVVFLADDFVYPLKLETDYFGFPKEFSAHVIHSYQRSLSPPPTFAAASVTSSQQEGDALLLRDLASGNYTGRCWNGVHHAFRDAHGREYDAHVRAVNTTITEFRVKDSERGDQAQVAMTGEPGHLDDLRLEDLAFRSPRALSGRQS